MLEVRKEVVLFWRSRVHRGLVIRVAIVLEIFKQGFDFRVGLGLEQSRKNPVSTSAMLIGKFLQFRKVFVTSSLLAEEFLDTLQYKISR